MITEHGTGLSALYSISEKGETVASVKSKFSEDTGIDYQNIYGKVVKRGSRESYYDRLVVVCGIPEE